MAQSLLADKFAPDGNLREACRKYVAGLYLKKYDKVQKLNSTVKHLHSHNNLYDERLKEIDLKSPIINKKNDIFLSDPQKTKERRAYDLEKKMIISNLEENKKILNSSKNELLLAQQKLKKLKIKLLKVFKIFEYNIKDKTVSGAYPFKVIYQDSCPKFYISCPLSKDKTVLLKEIFSDSSLPIVCEKYVSKRVRKKSLYSF